MSKSVGTIINPIIQFDSQLMPEYKNVTWMLKKKWIVEPDVLISEKRGEDMVFYPKSNVFIHLKDLARKKVDGYVIIRVKSKKQAGFLEENIKRRIKGKQIFVKHWNQGNQLDPEKYFNDIREGVLVVVIVQRKAAMGNSLSTEHIKFVYDYSPNAALSTISQGLKGRCCGHGKKKHPVIVYTHYNHAWAFSLFEQGKLQEFYRYLVATGIKPSQRSKVNPTYIPIFHGVIKVKKKIGIKDRDKARVLVQKRLEEEFGKDLFIDGTINTRFLEAQKKTKQRKWYLEQIKLGRNPVATRSLEKKTGKTTLFYDHRNNLIYFGHRIEGLCEYEITATNKSFYTNL